MQANVKPPLSDEQFQKASDLLLTGGLDYVSSDESEDETDQKNTRHVRRLWFESPEMAQLKRIIDDHYPQTVTSKKQLTNTLR